MVTDYDRALERDHPDRTRSGCESPSQTKLEPGHADDSQRETALAAVAAVCDPEIPVLTIADLGILRSLDLHDGTVDVAITPTYSGCPAMAAITIDIELALARAGFPDARVRTILSPAWTTDWLTDSAREKLRAYGIAPPAAAPRHALFAQPDLHCPRCNSPDTERLAEFGSTACKSLWRCRTCREPFDHFKCH